MDQDQTEAERLFREASERGNEFAKKCLDALNLNISVPNFTMFIVSYHVSLILKSVLFYAHYIPQIPSCVKALGVAIGVQTGPSKFQRPHILSIVLERSVLFYERWSMRLWKP